MGFAEAIADTTRSYMGDAIDGAELSVHAANDGHEIRVHWPDGGGYFLVMLATGADWHEQLPSFRENAEKLKDFWAEHGRWPKESELGRT